MNVHGALHGLRQGYGSFTHAYTNFNETAYFFEEGSPDQAFVGNCLDTLRKILSGQFFDTGVLEQVRHDVILEYEQTMPNAQFGVLRQLFLDTGVSINAPIGNLENIRRFTYWELMERHEKYYRFEHTAVIVLSGRQTGEIKELMEQVLGGEIEREYVC